MPGSEARIILRHPAAAIGLVAIGLAAIGSWRCCNPSAQTGSILGRAVIPAVQQVEYYNKNGAMMPLLATRRHHNTPARSGPFTSTAEFIFFSNRLYRGLLLAQKSKSNCNGITANDVQY
jgi:hypothetical protein